MDNRDPEKKAENLSRTDTRNKIRTIHSQHKESTAFLYTGHEQLDTASLFF